MASGLSGVMELSRWNCKRIDCCDCSYRKHTLKKLVEIDFHA